MRELSRAAIPLACLGWLLAGVAAAADASLAWKRLADLPGTQGVGGSFAGVADGALLVAGGTNFPTAPPWKGGRKAWYDTVYALDRPDGRWKTVGTLPRRLAYGVGVTHGDRLICVGGSDERAHYADAFSLAWHHGRLSASPLPPLPTPLANACGALVGDVLYVAGGQRRPRSAEASRAVYRMDLSATRPKWETLDALPGAGRILATAAACDGAFWVIGGAALTAGPHGEPVRHYLRDAYRYDAGKGWRRIADLPRASVAAPSPAPCDSQSLFLLGGDDGRQQQVECLETHPGGTRQILRYEVPSGRWSEAGALEAARVTAPCVVWKNRSIVVSGEARPGVRSPQIWSADWPPRDDPR